MYNQQQDYSSQPYGGANYQMMNNNNNNNNGGYQNPNDSYNNNNNNDAFMPVGQTGNTTRWNTHHGGNYNQNLHEGEYYNKDLDNSLEGSARNGFIKKVYTLLSLQLLFTMGVGYFAFNSDLFKNVFVNTPMIIILSVLLMAMSCVIGCCTDVFRKCALPIFIAFTLVFALLVGIIICGYKSNIVLLAFGITALVVISLTAFACLTKTDLTGCGPYLLVFAIVMMAFGIVAIFWRDPIVHLIYSCLSALLFAFYLVFDTQLVLGRGQYSYSLDDAYLAAIQLYIDIIELFIHILNIIGFASN